MWDRISNNSKDEKIKQSNIENMRIWIKDSEKIKDTIYTSLDRKYTYLTCAVLHMHREWFTK